jgi:uncharacterized protein (DUF924 family)
MTSPESHCAETTDDADVAWCQEVLAFWFRQLTPEQWWHKDDALDARVRQRFFRVYEDVASRPTMPIADPHVALAHVIVLDQFPRNMFRDKPRSYATDAKARAIAKAALAAGLDRDLSKSERLFLYMPLQHSEDLADQRRSLELVASLGDDELSHFAQAHLHIIERFGRFPHRNAILGRPSTPEEIEFLKSPMSSF